MLELAEEQPYRRRFLKQRKEKNDTIVVALSVTDSDVKMSMIYDLNVNGKQPNKMINLSFFVKRVNVNATFCATKCV